MTTKKQKPPSIEAILQSMIELDKPYVEFEFHSDFHTYTIQIAVVKPKAEIHPDKEFSIKAWRHT